MAERASTRSRLSAVLDRRHHLLDAGQRDVHARQGLREVAVALVGDDDAAAGLGDQEVGAGDADIGRQELSRAAWCAPRSGCRGVRGTRGRAAGRCADLRKLASQSSRLRWNAGAMMWLGSSWRSWMMYSPRSVSTGRDAVAFQVVVDAQLLADHRLALGDGARVRGAADRQHRGARLIGGGAPVHLAAGGQHLRLPVLQVEVEIAPACGS